MSGRVLLGALLLLAASALGPAHGGAAGRPIEGEERARLVERLRERQREIVSLRASVLQRRRHPLLKAEAVSRGTLVFQRPHRLRWEVTSPESLIVVTDGTTLLVYHPAKGEAERRDLRADFGVQAALDFLASGISLSVGELERRFEVTVFREDESLTFSLRPRSKWVSQAVASITLSQREGDPVPRQIVIVGRKGDRTETTLTDVEVNPRFAADPFTLRLGPEVRVTDLQGPGGSGSDP